MTHPGDCADGHNLVGTNLWQHKVTDLPAMHGDSGVVGVGSGVVASIRNDPLVQVVQLVWK